MARVCLPSIWSLVILCFNSLCSAMIYSVESTTSNTTTWTGDESAMFEVDVEWLDDMYFQTFLALLLMCTCLSILWVIYSLEYISRPVLTAPRDPVLLQTKQNQTLNLLDFVHRYCPSLTDWNLSFQPTWWLPNGHLQTFWAAYISDRYQDRVSYEREYIKTADNGTLSLDWTPPRQQAPIGKDTPIIVVCHGLTGGSHESYVQDVAHALVYSHLDPSQRPFLMKESDVFPCSSFRIVVANFRGCAKTPVTSPQLYCGAYTDDLRLAVKYLVTHYPTNPLYGIGFSLGANIMTKYVGEEGSNCVFKAMVSICNPYDLHTGSIAMHRSWVGRNIYSYKMTQNLKRVLKQQVLQRHLPIFSGSKMFDFTEAFSANYLMEFDSAITAKAFSFRTVTEYYRQGSSAPFIPDIRIPTLFMTALDDPVVSKETIPWYEIHHNPYTLLLTTKRGGHIGYFQGGNIWGFLGGHLLSIFGKASVNDMKAPQRWFPVPVVEFIVALTKQSACPYPRANKDSSNDTLKPAATSNNTTAQQSTESKPIEKPQEIKLVLNNIFKMYIHKLLEVDGKTVVAALLMSLGLVKIFNKQKRK